MPKEIKITPIVSEETRPKNMESYLWSDGMFRTHPEPKFFTQEDLNKVVQDEYNRIVKSIDKAKKNFMSDDENGWTKGMDILQAIRKRSK